MGLAGIRAHDAQLFNQSHLPHGHNACPDDFASGTSSKSAKLVHGGVRYLEKAVRELDYLQYCLVREALRERAISLAIAPHLSTSLPIMLTIYNWRKAP